MHKTMRTRDEIDELQEELFRIFGDDAPSPETLLDIRDLLASNTK